MRQRWVSLAIDSAPTYAAWAPVVARLWGRLGYEAIVCFHDSPGWDRPFGQLIQAELVESVRWLIGTTAPLSVANTMRASRLLASHSFSNAIGCGDFILTADVDMVPLDRAFFDRSEDFVVLRCLYQRWLACQGRTPELTADELRPGILGQIRFPMCYFGATAEIYRELFPPTLEELLVGTPEDCSDFDEVKLTVAVLRSPRSQGPLVTLGPGHWMRGALDLRDPVEAPLLSSYRDMPRGMLRLGDLWHPCQGTPIPDGAIDFIPPRFSNPADAPWWAFDVVKMRYPEEAAWIDGYRAALERSGW